MKAFKQVATVLLVLLWSLAALAQEGGKQEAPPTPLVSSSDQGQSEVTPDMRSLTGAQPFTLGGALERSYLTTSVRFWQSLDSNDQNQTGSSGVNAVGNVTGSLSLQKLWNRRQFEAHYVVGTTFSESQSGVNSTFHSFGLSQTFQFRHWSLNLMDEASYLPEAGFGYSGLVGFAGPDVLPQFLPNQSILTANAPRWANTVVGQVNYTLSAKTSFTTVGSFSMLRSSDANFVDTNQGNFSFGVNRTISARDTLGVMYSNNLFGFGTSASGRSLMNHSVQLAYGRRITGRLGLQVSGGPQFSAYDDRVAGSGMRTSYTLQSALSYLVRQTSVSVSYLHGVTGGAGVLTGASTHSVQGAISRQLTRTIAASLTTGYSRNSALSPFTPSATSFQSEFVGISLSRPLGHEANVFFNYNFQHQSSSSGACTGLVCVDDLARHVFGFGIEWHMRPMLLGR